MAIRRVLGVEEVMLMSELQADPSGIGGRVGEQRAFAPGPRAAQHTGASLSLLVDCTCRHTSTKLDWTADEAMPIIRQAQR